MMSRPGERRAINKVLEPSYNRWCPASTAPGPEPGFDSTTIEANMHEHRSYGIASNTPFWTLGGSPA